MKSSILVSSFLVVFLLAQISESRLSLKCANGEARKTKADQCAKNGFFLLNPDYQGHGGKNVDTYCKQVQDSITCIDKFNKDCLIGFAKSMATTGINGIKKHQRSICGAKGVPGPKKAEFLERTKWFTKASSDKLYPCVQASIKNMNHISDKIIGDQQIPQACCNYELTRKCLSDRMTSMTTADNKRFLEELADDSLNNLINTLCSKHDSIKSCKNDPITSAAMKRMRDVFKNPGPREQFESILIPFLDILTDN